MKKLLLLYIFILQTCFCSILVCQPTIFNLPQGPYGGGKGYDGIIQFVEYNTYASVYSYSGLKQALEDTSIHYIYIEDSSLITVPKDEYLSINRNNITLFGGRGKSDVVPGKIVRISNEPGTQRIIQIDGSNVRITGIDIIGPQSLNILPTNEKLSNYIINGIRVGNGENIEIDNCLIMGWTGSGINLYFNSNNTFIHHNVIKDNNSVNWSSISSFGYGISIYGDSAIATIAYNLFENNKHAIAGSSLGGESYIAAYNCILPDNYRRSHSFDMHGYYDRHSYPDSSCINPFDYCNYAGSSIIIENNFFEKIANNQSAIVIRGIPKIGAFINNNYYENNITENIAQRFYPGYKVYDSSNFININIDNNKLETNIKYFYTSWEAKSKWKLVAPFVYDIEEIGVGDFDGDGIDDLFRSFNGKWYISKRGSGNWELSGTSSINASEIIFADFTNDGRSDILTTWSGSWHLASANENGTFLSWENIGNGLGLNINEVVVGDFDNNGYQDLLSTENGYWLCAYNFNSVFQNWTQIGFSNHTINDFRVGDFDGNGYTDIFTNDTGTWKIAYNSLNGFGNWVEIGFFHYTLDQLLFADFDGDEDTDILVTDQNWHISYSNGSAKTFTHGNFVNMSSYLASDMFIGDFNGNGASDIGIIEEKILEYDKSARLIYDDTQYYDTFVNKNEIVIYPNPTKESIRIYSQETPLKMQLINLSGKVLLETRGLELNINKYPSGLYFIKIFFRQITTMHKIVKE